MCKTCSTCQQTQPLDAFSKNVRFPDGRERKCRTCLRRIRNAQRQKNLPHARAWKRQWKQKNPDRVKQHYANYYYGLSPEAKGKRKQYGRTYRQQHRAQINQTIQQWRKANILRLRLYYKRYLEDAARRAKHYKRMLPYNALRRARKQAAPFIEYAALDVIYARDRGICSLCHLHVKRADASRDHIIPVSKGGEESYRNVVLAHIACNSSKKDRTVTQQMRLF
jgi:5-methylcytosine-specific restriction endonuclease McrA